MRLDAALAGVQTGIVGSALMFGWMAIISVMYGRSPWHYSNLLATTFYGDDALRRGFRWMTVSGLALHAVLGVLIGVVFSITLTAFPNRRRAVLLGMLAATGWYYIGRGVIWPWLNPIVPMYAPEAAVVFGHVLLGACIGTSAEARVTLSGDNATPPGAAV